MELQSTTGEFTNDLVARYRNIINHLLHRYKIRDLEYALQTNSYFVRLPSDMGAIEQLIWGRLLSSLQREIDEQNMLAQEQEELLGRLRKVLEEAIAILKIDKPPVPVEPGEKLHEKSPVDSAVAEAVDVGSAAAEAVDVGIIVALFEEFRELHQALPNPVAVKDERTGASDYLFRWTVQSRSPYRCAATVVGVMG